MPTSQTPAGLEVIYVTYPEQCQGDRMRCFVNTRLGKFFWKNKGSLKMGLREGTAPRPCPFPRVSPLGPSLLWFVLLSTSGPCPWSWDHTLASPRDQDRLHGFRHALGSFPAVLKPPLGHQAITRPFSLSHLSWESCLLSLPLLPPLPPLHSVWSGSLPPPQGLPWSRSSWPL